MIPKIDPIPSTERRTADRVWIKLLKIRRVVVWFSTIYKSLPLQFPCMCVCVGEFLCVPRSPSSPLQGRTLHRCHRKECHHDETFNTFRSNSSRKGSPSMSNKSDKSKTWLGGNLITKFLIFHSDLTVGACCVYGTFARAVRDVERVHTCRFFSLLPLVGNVHYSRLLQAGGQPHTRWRICFSEIRFSPFRAVWWLAGDCWRQINREIQGKKLYLGVRKVVHFCPPPAGFVHRAVK